MIPLEKDLQQKKKSIQEFEEITVRVLEYLPSILSDFKNKSGYKIHSSYIAGTTKYIRPINQKLFIYSSSEFRTKLNKFHTLIEKLKTKNDKWDDSEKELIDSILYTIQQSIGAGFDLLVNPNSARKHVGNRFEELIKVIFTEIGIANKKTDLKNLSNLFLPK